MNDEHFSQVGRTMFLLAWIILFVVLFLVFNYFRASESTVYKVSSTEYSLSADREGHYRINGTINGYPVHFLVDTGATLVAVPQAVAEQAHLSGRYPVTITTANGEVTGSLTRLQSLSFGEFMLHDIKAVIIPGKDDDVVLLGMNVLSQFSMVQQDKKLILKRQ